MKRALIVLVALGALLLGARHFLPQAHPAAPGVPVGGTVAASPTTPAEGVPDVEPSTPPAPVPTHTGSDEGAAPKATSYAPWLKQAHTFATAFLHTKGVPAPTWRKRVQALSTPHLAAGLAYTDPDRVPAGKAGKATPELAYETGGGVAKISIGGSRSLTVTVVPAGKGYRVASVDES